MLTARAHLKSSRSGSGDIGVVRLGAAVGVTGTVIFVLCWLGTFMAFSSPTHAYIGLFTNANPQSLEALIEGGIWSLLFGTLSGALMAVVYNLFAGLERP